MKNIQKALLGIIIVGIFLILLMGTTVVSEDRSTITYTFGERSDLIAWSTNPDYMNDTNEHTYASTRTNSDTQLLTGNDYTPDHPTGSITKVEIRCKGYTSTEGHYIYLTYIWPEHGPAGYFVFEPHMTEPGQWSPWYEIGHPGHGKLLWSDIPVLDVEVKAVLGTGTFPVEWFCSIVQIKVTYTT